VEFRGFRYHTGVAFTVYGPGSTGEIGRGGRYLSGEESATGMTLFPDALLRGVAPAAARPRAFVPIGAPAEAARALRAKGIATVAQLSAGDTPESLRCTHVMDAAGTLRLIEE